MINNNPNNKTSQFYDLVSNHLKNAELLEQELVLIKSLLKNSNSILDIGCGTGRHLIPLKTSGYKTIGIDSSSGMLDELLKKNNTLNVIHADILNIPIPKEKFNLIIMMWNTFNEIALTPAKAIKLLKKCLELVKPDGKILINIDDRENLTLPNINFNYQEKNHVYNWKVIKYFPRTHITISKESITKNGKNTSTKITQRWWSLKEIDKLLSRLNLKLSQNTVSSNSELYLILQPKRL